MFDFGFAELLVVAIVALLVLGPERLPGAARFAGLWVRRARAQWYSVKAELESELADEELKRGLQRAQDELRTAREELRSGGESLRRGLDPQAASTPESPERDPHHPGPVEPPRRDPPPQEPPRRDPGTDEPERREPGQPRPERREPDPRDPGHPEPPEKILDGTGAGRHGPEPGPRDDAAR